jgi:hypothetical protein
MRVPFALFFFSNVQTAIPNGLLWLVVHLHHQSGAPDAIIKAFRTVPQSRWAVSPGSKILFTVFSLLRCVVRAPASVTWIASILRDIAPRWCDLNSQWRLFACAVSVHLCGAARVRSPMDCCGCNAAGGSLIGRPTVVRRKWRTKKKKRRDDNNPQWRVRDRSSFGARSNRRKSTHCVVSCAHRGDYCVKLYLHAEWKK